MAAPLQGIHPELGWAALRVGAGSKPPASCPANHRRVFPIPSSWRCLQAAADYLVGLSKLNHPPPAPVLSALLQHLGSSEGSEPAPAVVGANAGRLSDGRRAAAGTAGGPAHGEGQALPADGQLGKGSCDGLLLQRLSSQELVDLVCSLRPSLGSGQDCPGALLPPAVLENFFDALDTVLYARACLATCFSPSSGSPLALTGQHVGSLLHALGHLTICWPGSMPT